MATVEANDFAKEMSKILEGYAHESASVLKEEVNNASKVALKVLKQKAPKKHGAYAKTLKRKKVFENSNELTFVLYADKKGASVAHLLEKSHAKRNGGRTKAHPHFEPAYEAAEEYLDGKLAEKLGR